MLVCLEPAGLQPGPEVGLQTRLGCCGYPQPCCAAGAGSAGSAADELSSLHISTAPCGKTDGRPAAAAADTPATKHTHRCMFKSVHI